MQVAYSILSGKGNIRQSVPKARVKNIPAEKIPERKWMTSVLRKEIFFSGRKGLEKWSKRRISIN
jgi:hypothetical protein